MRKLIGLITLIGGMYCTGAYEDDIIFENNQQGYLYNIGTNGYVFNAETVGVGDVHSALSVTSEPEHAMPVKIIRKPFRGLTYNTIVTSPTSCRSIQANTQNSKCVFTYQKHLGKRTGFILDAERDTFDNYFMMSLPLTRDTNAFQIYNQGKCLTVDHMGVIDLEECIDATTKTKENQLFRWVDKEWFDTGMEKRQKRKHAYWDGKRK